MAKKWHWPKFYSLSSLFRYSLRRAALTNEAYNVSTWIFFFLFFHRPIMHRSSRTTIVMEDTFEQVFINSSDVCVYRRSYLGWLANCAHLVYVCRSAEIINLFNPVYIVICSLSLPIYNICYAFRDDDWLNRPSLKIMLFVYWATISSSASCCCSK